jgi:hypothetical protein
MFRVRGLSVSPFVPRWGWGGALASEPMIDRGRSMAHAGLSVLDSDTGVRRRLERI